MAPSLMVSRSIRRRSLANPFNGTVTTPQRRFTINPRVDYQLNDKNIADMLRYLRHAGGRSGRRHWQLRSGVARLSHRGSESDRASHRNCGAGRCYQRNALSVLPQRRPADREQRQPGDSGARIVQWRRSAGGPRLRHAELLRTAELHHHRSRVRMCGSSASGCAGRLMTIFRRRTLAARSPSRRSLGPLSWTRNNQPVLDASGQPVLTQITSIERYRRTLFIGSQARRRNAVQRSPTGTAWPWR